MPNYAESMKIDVARAERRLGFLEDRADWHLAKETVLDTACAATLWRDAGVISLLLGSVDGGRSFFRRAGRQLAQLGVFTGYLLESLADPELDFVESDESGIFSRLDDVFRGSEVRKPPDHPVRASFEADASTSLRQLLNLYQAARGGRRRSERVATFANYAKDRLWPGAAAIVGVTGLPIKSYLNLFDHFGINEADPRDRELLLSVVIRRNEILEAAQSDEFHWRMMLKPAEVVDLDLVALGMNALEAGAADALFETVSDRDMVASLPFLLARDLHGGYWERPKPAYRYG